MARNLDKATTIDDSIRILYDVYDLSERGSKLDVGLKILNLAQRSDNRVVMLDILSRLSSKMSDTEGLQRLLEISRSLPQDSLSKGVGLAIEMQMVNKELTDQEDISREKKLIDYARIDLNDKEDIYEEIIDLYRTLVYLGPTSQGSLYLEYLTRLEDLVKSLPIEDFAIRNLYYTTAAIYYSHRRDYKKAIESDENIIHELNLLQDRFDKDQRKYQNFDYSRYISYRRILSNYKGLTEEEADSIYNLCVALAETNEEVGNEFGKRGQSKAYYHLSKGQYAEAIPYLKQALSNPDISDFRREDLLGYLATAQKAIGDEKGLLETLDEYTPLLIAERQKNVDDAYHELEIRSAVNRLTLEERTEQEKMRAENRRMRRLAISLVYVLALILIFLCQKYFKLRHQVKVLERNNFTLHNNIENILDDGMPHGTTDINKHKNRLKG